MYTIVNEFGLVRYTYVDWTRSVDDRKSTLGYVFHLDLGVIL